MSPAPTKGSNPKKDESDKKIAEMVRGRPIMVTGADGMVGSHLTEKLLELGAKVHVFVRATSSGMLHNIAHVQKQIVIHRGDLTDKQAITVALKALKSDGGQPIVFHLGAQAHVGESWARSYETVATNFTGTLNLLQSIVDIELDVLRVDTAGSSEEYGNVLPDVRHHYRFDGDSLLLDEHSPVNPQSPYATAKLAADFITRNFHAAYGLPTIVTRMFNNYGPRQNPRFVTGTVISQALSRDVIELGYGKSKRDFCFVKDGAMGHLHACLFGTPGDLYVYGQGKAISIEDWARLIVATGTKNGVWGAKELKFNSGQRSRLGKSEVEELRVDYKKLHGLTGWEPTHTWEEGIGETIKWYAANRDRWIGRVDWL